MKFVSSKSSRGTNSENSKRGTVKRGANIRNTDKSHDDRPLTGKPVAGTHRKVRRRRRFLSWNMLIVCVAAALFLTIGGLLIRGIIRYRQQEADHGAAGARNGIATVSPFDASNGDSASANIETMQDSDTEAHDYDDANAMFSDAPGTGDDAAANDNADTQIVGDGEDGAEAIEPDDEVETSAPDSGDNSTESPEPGDTDNSKETPPATPPATDVQFSIDDSALRANANNVYYHIYHYGSGQYSTSGNSAQTPSASVIKVFIMEYAFHRSEGGIEALSATIGGNTILSLVTSMIRQSDNSATNVLIDHYGMEALNQFFAARGYSDTSVQRRMLDLERRAAGYDNYTSLNDCVSFLNRLYLNRGEQPWQQMMDIMLGQQIRTKIPRGLPSGVAVANKTGELDDVENDIGIVFTEDSAFAIIVLTYSVRSTENTRTAIADFALAAYNHLA